MLTEREIILTPAGVEKVEVELERLIKVDRREIAERIRESKSYAETSEGGNTAYEEAKAEQGMIEARILELKQILHSARVITDNDIPTDEVGVGSVVTIQDLETNERWDYRIVGPIEASPDDDMISYESPVGDALMGAKPGDVVEINVPVGLLRYKILKIGK
ncbi:MAG: transcription elongation factor GreA [Armatimonadetes bacterium]|nr:transcription elongation factor GreA [Armatimonadota bacterium]